MKELTRREFLTNSAGATAVAVPLFAPGRTRGANEQLAFGLIGAGGRGRYLHRTFQQLGARCLAVAEVYAPNREAALQGSPPGTREYTDYRELLAREPVDFVVIGTPDHQHCPNLLAALQAGKDVYLEKPLSMSLEESGRMVRAVRATRQIVQIGMQRRSMQFVRRAKQDIDDGVLGEVSMAKAMWNWHFAVPLDNSPLSGTLDWELFLGPAPRRPLEPKRFRWWRAFWDYSGGNMTDQGTHLMDVVQWMTNSGPPRSAVCQGFIADATAGEVPDVFSAVFEYPRTLATWTLNYTNAYQHDWSILFQGRDATMLMDERGYRIYRDTEPSPQPWSQPADRELLAEVPDDGKGAEMHMQNLLDCIRSRQEPNCPVEVAAAAVTGPHMANVALREDRKVKLGADGFSAA